MAGLFLLAGCEKTLLARKNVSGPYVWHKRIIVRDGRDGRGFEVRSSRFSELRTPNVELRSAPFSHFSGVTRLGPWPLADFFSSLLGPYVPSSDVSHITSSQIRLSRSYRST